VEPASDRVRQPRHFLLYRTCDDGRVEIGRVLHERMDLAQHLPEGYEPKTTSEHPPESP
jgi:plasmid stabilization system protein ParE